MKSSRNTVHKSRNVLRLNVMETVNGDEGSIPFTRSNIHRLFLNLLDFSDGLVP
jgi:hypothetical protein